MHPAIAAVAIAFWIFIAVVSVAGIIQDYRKRQLALEPLRLAIQHGQTLDPEIITRLLSQEVRHDRLDPRPLQVGGIITCAAGVGIAILSAFLAAVLPRSHMIVLGVGVLTLCIGVGLLIAAWSLRRSGSQNNPA